MEAIAKSAGSTVLQTTDGSMLTGVGLEPGCWNCICFGS
jgi:hypothetical protein